jgi:predicted alpha/beta hydrolase family esterase
MHHVTKHSGERVDRVLLVAPPAPDSGIDQIAGFFPVPLDGDAIRDAATETLLVYADDDPYCPGGGKERFGDPLGIESVLIPDGAHLNVEAGYGPWPEVEEWATAGKFVVTR